MNRAALLKLVLWILTIYHLGIGLVSMLAPETTVEIGRALYGISVDQSAAQFAYMLKALGMYALFTGGLLALTLTDPQRYRHLLIAVACLLIMRATTRVIFYDTLHEAFGLAWGRNLFNVLFMLAKAGVLLWSAAALRPAGEDLDQPVRPALLTPQLLASASRRLQTQSTLLASASGIR